jgi:hypothetical protein
VDPRRRDRLVVALLAAFILPFLGLKRFLEERRN